MSEDSQAQAGAAALEKERAAERARFTGVARWTIVAGTLAAILLAVNQLFNLRLGGYSMLEGMYLYILAGIFLALTFVCFRAFGPRTTRVPWYDWLLAGLTVALTGFFVATAN